jgi:hypothetical protein
VKTLDPNTAPELPEGLDAGDVTVCAWEDYPGDYEKSFAQVILKNGSFDPTWHWPNADHFGDHHHSQVARVRYARWKDV